MLNCLLVWLLVCNLPNVPAESCSWSTKPVASPLELMTLYVVDAEVAGNCRKSSSASWLVVIQVAKRSNLLPPFGVWIMCFMPLVCGKFSNQRRNPRERLALMRPSRVSFSGCMSVCVCCGTLRLHANIDELVPELGHVSIECWCLKPFASNSNSNSYIKVVACRPLGLSFASGYISIEVDEACPGFTILNTSAAHNASGK